MLAPKSTGKPTGKRKRSVIHTRSFNPRDVDRLCLNSSFWEESSPGSSCESQVSYLANRAVLLRS